MMEEQLQYLFDKQEWSGDDDRLFLQLTERYSLAELQYFFQNDFIEHLSEIRPRDGIHARALLARIHQAAGTAAHAVQTTGTISHGTSIVEAAIQRHAVGRVRWRIAAAAAVILLCVAGAVLLRPRQAERHISAVAGVGQQEVSPGRDRAVLTLAGGKQLMLDRAGSGTIAVQGGAEVMKTADGSIAYKGAAEKAVYNTLSTPRGGQYSLTLPDGTKVWLNAASSITYPTAFTDAKRSVTVTGEVYFEVAKDAEKPFVVAAAGLSVEVLGTSFNMNVYEDEPRSATTLVEGKIRVDGIVLQPGQQVVKAAGGKTELRWQADVEEALAWKNGTFRFKWTDLRSVMRQLSRWYDIDVVYAAGVPDIQFSGDMKRDLNLTEVLTLLRGMKKFNCKLEGRKLTILTAAP